MDELKKKTEEMIAFMGFKDFEVSYDPAAKKISVIINDSAIKEQIGAMVLSFNSIIRVIAKKLSIPEPIIFDINNYHKDRELIIIDLAKAAARKAVATKEPIALPAMNAY